MTASLNHATNEYARRLAEQSRTPSQYKVEPKIYFHRHNYAKFHFDLGQQGSVKTVAFANYRYITDDKREQDQLDMVADAPGTMIYTISDSEVNAAFEQELQQELGKDVLRAAQARAAVHGQAFDPNAPIVPVNGDLQVRHQQPTQVTVKPVVPNLGNQGQAVVGMQNSMSGTQAVEGVQGGEVAKTAAPSAADLAAESLRAMTEAAKAQQNK